MITRRCTDAEVQEILRDPTLLEPLIDAFESGDRVRMEHASECLKKVALERPALIAPYIAIVLEPMGRADSWLVKLRVTQIIPHLKLTAANRRNAFELMQSYLEESSSIVRTWAMQAMFFLSQQDSSLRDDVLTVIDRALSKGTAAMKARARHLLRDLNKESTAKLNK
jgi:hypothetical protein